MKLFLLLLFLVSCATRPPKHEPSPRSEKFHVLLDQAEQRASPEGRSILVLAREMIKNGERIEGSCWNYINHVYDRAGFKSKQRETVFKSKLKGPYLKKDLIQPGDWLYYVNHSYNRREHSGVFVEWIDFEAKEALIMSYAGEKKKTAARYKKYDIRQVYNVIRPLAGP